MCGLHPPSSDGAHGRPQALRIHVDEVGLRECFRKASDQRRDPRITALTVSCTPTSVSARLKKSITMTTLSWEDAARLQGYLDFVPSEQAESPAPDALLTLRNGKQIDTRPEVVCGFLAFLRWGERGAPIEASEKPNKTFEAIRYHQECAPTLEEGLCKRHQAPAGLMSIRNQRNI